mmetsp:Transcript_2714/g.3958  ORF Transcript_2714/g.3958 Transcript_2714/m.3958 type:complete len:463 (-) Transcript_2714:117-1505(-)
MMGKNGIICRTSIVGFIAVLCGTTLGFQNSISGRQHTRPLRTHISRFDTTSSTIRKNTGSFTCWQPSSKKDYHCGRVAASSASMDGESSDQSSNNNDVIVQTSTHTDANTNSNQLAVNGDSSSSTFKSTDDDETITRKDSITISLTAVGVILAFVGLISAGGPGAWRYYLAGGICAASSHAITTPIDVVKTRQQVDSTYKERGMVASTLKLVKDEGFQTLLAGLGPTVFGYLMEGAVKFGVYEVLKPAVGRFLSWAAAVSSIPSLSSRYLGFIICGMFSGVAASAMLCPMEALRIRLVAEPKFARKGWIHGGLKMFKNEGSRGLWKGMNAMMCKQVPYTVTKNVSFDFFTTVAYATAVNLGYAITAKTKFAIPFLCAVAASVLSCISSQPGDMLLSVVNAHKGEKRVRDFSKEIAKKEGVKGFFIGIQARFLHVGIIVTVQLLLYDFVKRLCGIAATGLASG